MPRWHDDALPSEHLARICYHVPFCKMARKAHLCLRRCDLEDRGEPWDVVAEEQDGAASFREQVEPSLGLCARVGNVYTASLYLGLAGLLDAQAAQLANARIGLFSYGSGCTSEFFSGVVGPRAEERIGAARIAEVLGARERITVEEYERIMAMSPSAPLREPAPADGFRFTGVHHHRRQYEGDPPAWPTPVERSAALRA
jgi:hydroxymethylglutaryl-CoA synthase